MNRLSISVTKSILAFACLLLLSAPLQAAEILTYLPNNALSFALIRDVQATNDKIVKFVDIFREGMPAPLEMTQAMTGLSEGLNLNGDVLFALLPAGEPTAVPAPMFLLPVADYAAFATSIKGDTTGEICRVNIAEEDVLVARQGPYALVMNLEHREIMQKILGKHGEVASEITQQQSWLQKNDISMMVTTAGIAYLAEAAKREMSQQPVDVGDAEVFAESAIAQDMLSVGDALPFSEFLEEQIEIAGMGFVIDDAINARLRWTVEFKEKGSQSADAMTVEEKPLMGYADKPYAIAGGGPIPLQLIAVLPELFTQLSQEVADVDGRGDFTEKDWEDVRKSYEMAFASLRGASILLTPVAEREPLLSIIFARLQVVETTNYLESLKKTFELTNQLAARSKSDIELHYEVTPITIAGAKGIEITCDLDKATGDGDNHIWQALLTSLLGIDHKLSWYFCAVDDTHVVVGLESQAKLGEFIEAFRKGDTSLASNTQVKKTLELLGEETPWITLFNPQGLIELVQSAMKSMMILGFVPEFPHYPTAPPLGMTLATENAAWHGEIVLPVDAARAMAEFSKEVENGLAQ